MKLSDWPSIDKMGKPHAEFLGGNDEMDQNWEKSVVLFPILQMQGKGEVEDG